MAKKGLYIFMGPPGAGKGSLASLCVKNLGWQQLSTGNLCRKEISQGTEIGKQIDLMIKSGKLVPDGLIARMIEGELAQRMVDASAVILDGFPRTVPQAQELGRLIARDIFSLLDLTVIRLYVPDDTVVMRLTSRLFCPNNECQAVYSTVNTALQPRQAMTCDACSASLTRRSDDNEAVIRNRLTQYHVHEGLLIDYYREQGCAALDLCVEKPLEGIFSEFKYMLGIERL